MENMKYAEELVREFLVFRGFTKTLRAYESELSSDIGRGFQVHKIIDLIFSIYIPKFEVERLTGLLNFLKHCFFSPSDAHLNATMSKMELSTIKYYIIYCLQRNRQDKVVDFFGLYGNEMLQSSDDWTPWFAIPYLKNPSLDPRFRMYFSKEWLDALLVSFRNFLSEVFNGTRLPAVLRVTVERASIKGLKQEVGRLNSELSKLRKLLHSKEIELSQLKGLVPSDEVRKCQGACRNLDSNDAESQSTDQTVELSKSTDMSSSRLHEGVENPTSEVSSSRTPIVRHDSDSYHAISEGKETIHCSDNLKPSSRMGPVYGDETSGRECLVEVAVESQETFSGHTSPIARCRFSAEGTNVASASIDGTVRIWTYDSSASTSRNATIYCGAEIMSLDWEYKFDRLLLIGTAEGGIKAWNVDAKRVVCDLNTGISFPYVLDLKCSPVDSLFVSAAASRGKSTEGVGKLGFASLTAWNMKTWKPVTAFPLGEDPPAITSVCFNHNGKILAASATDGMIHLFDMSAGLPITGWPAHDTPISCVKFGPDEASVFSLGLDGKIFEWSLHNQGQVLWSKDASSYILHDNSQLPRHEMAFDGKGRTLLLTSDTTQAPLYQCQGKFEGKKTPAHGGPITSVDWHPTAQTFLTGSADHSVHVTSIV